MIVVSDTGPIHYLVLIGQDRILPVLFGKVLVPEGVLRELSQPDTPRAVVGWTERPPAWLLVQRPAAILADLRLDPGETEALSLAVELSGAFLTDDRRAMAVARTREVPTFGTLGILQQAYARSLLEIDEALAALAATNFRRTDALFERVREGALKLRPIDAERGGPQGSATPAVGD